MPQWLRCMGNLRCYRVRSLQIREWKQNVFCAAAHCCLWCGLSEVCKAAVDDQTLSICALVVVRIEFCDIYEQKLFSFMFRDQESLKNPWRIPEIFKDRMITQASLQDDTMLIAVAFSIFLSFSFIFFSLRYSRIFRVRTSHTNIRFSGQRPGTCDNLLLRNFLWKSLLWWNLWSSLKQEIPRNQALKKGKIKGKKKKWNEPLKRTWAQHGKKCVEIPASSCWRHHMRSLNM